MNCGCRHRECAHRPNSPQIDKCSPTLAECSPELAKLGRNWSNSRRNWPASPRIDESRDRLGLRPQLGPFPATMGRCRPKLAEFGPESANFAPKLAKSRERMGRTRPTAKSTDPVPSDRSPNGLRNIFRRINHIFAMLPLPAKATVLPAVQEDFFPSAADRFDAAPAALWCLHRPWRRPQAGYLERRARG